MSEPPTSWHDAPNAEDPQHAEYLQHAEDPQHSEAQENEENDEDSDVISCMSPPIANYFVDNLQPSEYPCRDYLDRKPRTRQNGKVLSKPPRQSQKEYNFAAEVVPDTSVTQNYSLGGRKVARCRRKTRTRHIGGVQIELSWWLE
jgi:hypothetical protein